ncbi:MAG: hypothetical protein ABSA93_13320 [Streptosporangiaceae bacterium]|jgi:pyruvate dehydrogenase (quinone)
MRQQNGRQVGIATLITARSAGDPALLDVVTTPDALEIPSHVTVAEARGFALSVGKMVLGGGVGQLAELARVNVRNIPKP